MSDYTDEFFLNLVESMPPEDKRCSVHTGEDGQGTVELRDFIINYGRALVAHIDGNKKED
jgi:hypothetical protein